MGQKILLLQYRDDVSTEHEQQCVIEKAAIDENHMLIINAVRDKEIPEPKSFLNEVSIILIGGSGQYDLSKEPEPLMQAIDRTADLIDKILETDIPTLGICFGHQLIAQKLGADVEDVKDFAEDGTYMMELTEQGVDDKIFEGFPKEFMVQFGHKESVVNIPKEIIPLGYSVNGALAAYRYKQNIYGVQFHPELDAESSFYRSKLYPEYTNGKTDEEIRAGMLDAPYNDIFLKKFVDPIL